MIEPLSKCPFCSVPYDGERVRKLSQHKGSELLHASCFGCRRAMMFVVERREGHVACVGIFTDCDVADAKKFLEKPKISLDDVLRAHELLSQKNL